MLVLHGFWLPGRGLCLWAEDSGRAVTSRSQALRSPRPHPFAAPAGVLAGICPGKPGDTVLRLPSLAKSPLDSPELIRVIPRGQPQTQPVLLAWRVPVVSLEASGALGWLETVADGHDVACGTDEAVRHGASMSYLAKLAVFARELTERGRVLPALAHDETGPLACWRPVLQGPDVVTLGALAAVMPPVCRAAADGEGSPLDLATDALRALTDAAARDRLVPGVQLVPPRRGRRPARMPVAESWLDALTAPDGRFDASEDEVGALERALRPWAEIGTGRVGPARATFRLSEVQPQRSLDELLEEALGTELEEGPGDGLADGPAPGPVPESAAESLDDEPSPQWRLEFMLQSTQDPSLLVPAAQVWSDNGSLRRWLDRPQELLLGELGRASRVYPELAPGLRQATPCALGLDAHGAYHFLSAAAPALDEAGFGVLLPAWWDSRARLGLKASATTPTDGVVAKDKKFGKDQLMDFRWQLAVGNDTLTEEEIAALAAAKAPLIRLRGQWVAVDPDQLRRGLAFLEREPGDQKTAAEVLALAASHPDDLDTPLPVTAVQADGWLGDLLSGAAAQSLQPVAPPGSLSAELRGYQQRGLSWLVFLSSLRLGCCLADDMGLGKTVQLLALEAAHRAEHPGAAPTLLLCPMSLVGNWQREAARFTPGLRVYAHHGRERLHGEALAARLGGTDLIVTTYATAVRDIDELAGLGWERVVLDEAQAIKNSLSQSAKAAKRLRAGHRIALTGTPVENRLAELWSVMDFLNPGMLGSPEQFRARYAVPVERHNLTGPAERLRAITRPYILRRLKSDPAIINDLPEKIEIKQYCQLTVEQASLYQSIVDDMMDKIENSEGIERRGNVLAAMAKLKQVCNHPAQVLHDRSAIGRRSGKVIRLEEILEEILAEGDRVLCFTQFTEFAELLLPHLSARFGTDVSYLHGGTPRKRRDELVTRFQSGDGPPIFLLSLKAGGTGLNLTAASHVIHLDRWWNPAVENQATDRAFRIGQRRNVEVHKFISTGTLEEKIDDMIEEKKALANLVVGDGETWLTELSTADLRRVFALSQEAIGE